MARSVVAHQATDSIVEQVGAKADAHRHTNFEVLCSACRSGAARAAKGAVDLAVISQVATDPSLLCGIRCCECPPVSLTSGASHRPRPGVLLNGDGPNAEKGIAVGARLVLRIELGHMCAVDVELEGDLFDHTRVGAQHPDGVGG